MSSGSSTSILLSVSAYGISWSSLVNGSDESSFSLVDRRPTRKPLSDLTRFKEIKKKTLRREKRRLHKEPQPVRKMTTMTMMM